MTLQCNPLIENLTTYTENIYQYIEALYGTFNQTTQEIWQRQLSDTFIQYPDMQITDLEENLIQEGITEPNSKTRALTAFWLLRCYTQKYQDYPNLVRDNLTVLENAMWTPFNNLPPTAIQSLDLRNNQLSINGTDISLHMQTLGRIQVLNYLITHYQEIKDSFDQSSAEDQQNYALLKTLDKQWIIRQMAAIQAISDFPGSTYRRNYWEARSQFNQSRVTPQQPQMPQVSDPDLDPATIRQQTGAQARLNPPVEHRKAKYLSLLLTHLLPPLMGLGIAYPAWLLISPLSPFFLTLLAVTSVTIATTITVAWGFQRFVAPMLKVMFQPTQPAVVPCATPSEGLGSIPPVTTRTAPRVSPSVSSLYWEERSMLPTYSRHRNSLWFEAQRRAQSRSNRSQTQTRPNF